MTNELTGQVALVTGGSRNIGRRTALALADRGADVIVTYKERRDAAEETLIHLRERGSRATALQADLTGTKQIPHLVAGAREVLHGWSRMHGVPRTIALDIAPPALPGGRCTKWFIGSTSPSKFIPAPRPTPCTRCCATARAGRPGRRSIRSSWSGLVSRSRKESAIRIFRRGKVAGRDQVAELILDRRLSYLHLSGLPVRDYRADVDLEPEVEGTRIRWRVSFTPKVPGTGWLWRWAIERFITQCARGLAAYAQTASAHER